MEEVRNNCTLLSPAKWPPPPLGCEVAVPALFFPLGLHNLRCLSQCPGGHLPTLLFTNIPSLPRPAPVVHGYMMEGGRTQPLIR
jgi:hypothetical protein